MKIDKLAVFEAFMQEVRGLRIEDETTRMGIDGAFAELSRQLVAAGAPPGDLETQLRALLSRPPPIEPGQDVVEALARVLKASWAEDDGDPEWSKMARAVLSALAEMGAEQMPSEDDVFKAIESECDLRDYSWIAESCAVRDMVAARLTPVLVAKDARIRELEAQRNEAQGLANLRGTELSHMRRADHPHELGSCSRCDAPQNIGVTQKPPPPPPPSAVPDVYASAVYKDMCGVPFVHGIYCSLDRDHSGKHMVTDPSGQVVEWRSK